MQMRLKCNIERGMFSDERVIVVRDAGGREADFFVPASFVDEKSRTVRVSIVNGPTSGHKLAVIPTSRRPTIEVRSSDLVES